jgi:hypothetical protein
MADKYPETHRSDVAPGKNSFPDKKKGESFDEAMNAPNDPKKRYPPTSFNVTDDYCDEDYDND